MVSVNQVRHFFNVDSYSAVTVKAIKENGEPTGFILQFRDVNNNVVLTSDVVK